MTPKKVPGGGVPTAREMGVWRVGERRSAVPSRSVGSAPGSGKQPAQSSRYTPPKRAVRIRPRWHRPAGWIGLALGVLVAVVNDVMLINDVTLLPFGHNEAWLFVGVFIACGSTWFLGLFDRGTTIYK